MPKERKRFLNVAVEAARRAAGVIIGNLGSISQDDIDLKQTSDFVTRVDRASEEVIIETIRGYFPGHSFLAEESLREDDPTGYRWIIDPLDGTTNYIHRYPVFSVSIALQQKGKLIIGVILDPTRNELFTAEEGGGAFLNGKPLRVSTAVALADSLIATGFPFRKREMIDLYLKLFKNIFKRVSDLRRAGSAALDLAYLACGRCDGFFEIGLSPWDIAAGSLLVREAGGVVTDFGGGPDYLTTGNIVAGTPTIHKEILQHVRRIFRLTEIIQELPPYNDL